MDPDTDKSCLLAADDERGEVRQGSTNRHSESDPDSSHLGEHFFISEPHLNNTEPR